MEVDAGSCFSWYVSLGVDMTDAFSILYLRVVSFKFVAYCWLAALLPFNINVANGNKIINLFAFIIFFGFIKKYGSQK
jgi:hypothetical protein